MDGWKYWFFYQILTHVTKERVNGTIDEDELITLYNNSSNEKIDGAVMAELLMLRDSKTTTNSTYIEFTKSLKQADKADFGYLIFSEGKHRNNISMMDIGCNLMSKDKTYKSTLKEIAIPAYMELEEPTRAYIINIYLKIRENKGDLFEKLLNKSNES